MATSEERDPFHFPADTGPQRDWVTVAGTLHLLRAVAACGQDAERLRRQFAIPSIEDCFRRIAASTMIALWEAGIEVTGRRDLAAIAQTRRWTDEVSWLGFVAANQRTIGDAIDVLHRYGTTFSDCYGWQIVDDGENITLRTDPVGPIDRIGWQAYQEFQAFDVAAISRRLNDQMVPLRMSFVHPRPDPIGALAEVGGIAPEFSATRQELSYPSFVRALPIEYARPLMAQQFEHRLSTTLSELADQPSVATRARALVARLVLAGRAAVDELAAALAMSRRSLERALAAEGVSATALFTEERHRLARLWLPCLNVDEVARRLGYANAPAFSRAFRRWTGLSPCRFRERSPDPDPERTARQRRSRTRRR